MPYWCSWFSFLSNYAFGWHSFTRPSTGSLRLWVSLRDSQISPNGSSLWQWGDSTVTPPWVWGDRARFSPGAKCAVLDSAEAFKLSPEKCWANERFVCEVKPKWSLEEGVEEETPDGEFQTVGCTLPALGLWARPQEVAVGPGSRSKTRHPDETVVGTVKRGVTAPWLN